MSDFLEVTHYIDGEDSLEINLNRTGALNRALMTRLTELSVSDDWDEAKHEWRATGEVWYRPLRYAETEIQQIPEPHCNNHPNKCVCGHPIAWHFEVENTENNTKEILGSEHITNWMIIRHLKELKNIPADAITDEKIIEWMKEAVKTMKAEWWWKENGDDWEEMFNEVKELDLRINVRTKGKYYDRETRRYEDHMTIAKTKNGSLGKMSSVVWRWNHPDNARRQIDTRGYPNEKLWRDVRILFAKMERFEQQLNDRDTEMAERKEQIRNEREAEMLKNQERQIAIREEAERIRSETKEEYENIALKEACEYYDIPYFNLEMGNNDWEKTFLNDMSNRIIRKQTLSVRQLNKLLKIIAPDSTEPEPASHKQISYIKKLGGDVVEGLTKTDASKLIGELLGGN
tara:strand:+ start:639 stop:1844 length:1206 start_codon:yes stop_codon:yes gene_type:complete